jgi:hypothetical protein
VWLTSKACSDLRIEGIQFDHAVSNESIALSCLRVEVLHVTSEGADQWSCSVRVADYEIYSGLKGDGVSYWKYREGEDVDERIE